MIHFIVARSLTLACVIGLLIPGVIFAKPVYYTFQGVLDYTYGDEASGVISRQQDVEYVYMVDREADGFLTRENGDVRYLVDSSQYNYYYAELLYASGPVGGIYQDHLQSRNYGRDTLLPFWKTESLLFTGNKTVLKLTFDNIFDIVVGDKFEPTSWINVSWTNEGEPFGMDSLSYFLVHELAVVSVSETFPVKLSGVGTIYLLVTGLLGLWMASRKQAAKF